MLEKLKKIIKKHGVAKVASDLGYRSSMAVYGWVKKGKIPSIAEEKVKQYLKEQQ